MWESSLNNLSENLKYVQDGVNEACLRAGRVRSSVRIMAVTKTVPPELVNAAIRLGVDLAGENRVQELLAKYGSYEPCELHFIGSLQTNKVKYLADKVSMIQSVDSVRLAQEISRRSQAADRRMDLLLEVNIGGEESKGGIAPEAAAEIAAQIAELPSVRVRGLMAIPPFSTDPAVSGKFFEGMRQLFVDISGKKIDNVSMEVLSMGMSGDYRMAIEHGATIIRLGRALFGERTVC